jgi:hypothetical protein
VEIPLSEGQRLVRAFQTATPLDYQLDLIVLTNDESLADLAPSPRDFELTFSNDTFRMWRRTS